MSFFVNFVRYVLTAYNEINEKIGNKAYKYLVSCAWRKYAYKIGRLQTTRKIIIKLFSVFRFFKNNIIPNGKKY